MSDRDDAENEQRLCEECGLEISGQWAVKNGKYWHPDCYPHDPDDASWRSER